MQIPRRALLAASLAAPATLAAQDTGEVVHSERGAFRVRVLTDQLQRPWGGGFLPDGRLLVTERAGRARLMSPDGELSAPLPGVPEVLAEGQGGLLDMQPAPDFATTNEVFFTSATMVEGGALTRLSRARLGTHGLEAARPVLDCSPAQSRGRLHYGGRIAFAPDGRHIFLTTGDRNEERERAQKLNDLAGKVIRLTREGQVPRDNPFVERQGHRAEIWSYGHRNSQGIAFDPTTGGLICAEHGPRGGDEINLIEPGQNYGWPNVSYGREYSGFRIAGGQTSGPGITEPLRHWVPSVSPSGINFAPADAQPLWRGALYMACLNTPGLLRVNMAGGQVTGEERLLWGRARMRQVLFTPDGALLLLTDETRGRVLRLDAV